jgi:protein KTI12
MNYIKGFRYELFCIAKSYGMMHGVIWVLCPSDAGDAWNDLRIRQIQKNTDMVGDTGNEFYTQDMMNALRLRFEPPDQRNRWDRPLFRVNVTSAKDYIMTEKKNTESHQNQNLAENMNNNHNLKQNLDDGCSQNNQSSSYVGENEEDAAEKILHQSVYNMHSLRDSIRGEEQKINTSTKKRIGSSFKRPTNFKSNTTRLACTLTTNTDVNNVESTASKDHDDSSNNNNSITPTTTTATNSPINHPPSTTMEELIDEILNSFLLNTQPLKEGLSTKLHTSAESNVLHDIDRISQLYTTSIMNAMKTWGGGGKIQIPLQQQVQNECTNMMSSSMNTSSSCDYTNEMYAMEVKRRISVVEVKKWRKEYVRWVADHPPSDTSAVGIGRSFLMYVQNQI